MQTFFLLFAQTLTNHYPERVLRILVVNAPRYVLFLFSPFSHPFPSVLPPFLLVISTSSPSLPPSPHSPRFFGPIFKLLSTVMPASLRDQLQICSSLEDIEKFISIDVLPPEYGGRSPFKLGEAEEEVELRAFVMKNNAAAAAAGGGAT